MKTNKAGDKKEIDLASEKEIDGKRYSKANQKDNDLQGSTQSYPNPFEKPKDS